MSLCWVGCTHDFSMLKEEFPPNKNWFKNHKIRLDLGYQGFQHDYACKELSIPKKRKKGGCLSLIDKENNKSKSKSRIAVEHSLSGLKRYRVLVNRLRIKDFDYYNDILGVCAGLWNHYLSH
jgi:hypothetical protein